MTVVSREIAGWVNASSTEHIRSIFSYDTADPYAISINFLSQKKKWFFARSLLVDALGDMARHGDGDVSVQALGNQVRIHLTPPNSSVMITYARTAIEEFIRATEALIKSGDESLYVSRLFDQLENWRKT